MNDVNEKDLKLAAEFMVGVGSELAVVDAQAIAAGNTIRDNRANRLNPRETLAPLLSTTGIVPPPRSNVAPIPDSVLAATKELASLAKERPDLIRQPLAPRTSPAPAAPPAPPQPQSMQLELPFRVEKPPQEDFVGFVQRQFASVQDDLTIIKEILKEVRNNTRKKRLGREDQRDTGAN